MLLRSGFAVVRVLTFATSLVGAASLSWCRRSARYHSRQFCACVRIATGAFSRRIASIAHQEHTLVAFLRFEPRTYTCGTYGSISYAKRLETTKCFEYVCSGELGDVIEESGFSFE